MENRRTSAPLAASLISHTHTHETKQFHEEGIYRFIILLHRTTILLSRLAKVIFSSFWWIWLALDNLNDEYGNFPRASTAQHTPSRLIPMHHASYQHKSRPRNCDMCQHDNLPRVIFTSGCGHSRWFPTIFFSISAVTSTCSIRLDVTVWETLLVLESW